MLKLKNVLEFLGFSFSTSFQLCCFHKQQSRGHDGGGRGYKISPKPQHASHAEWHCWKS